MVLTALCTDVGPSGPLSARPGPSMLQREAITIVRRPKPIDAVVQLKYPN